MTTHRLLFLAAGLLASSLAVGALTPQSFLDGNPQSKASTLYPVRIVAVDGEMQHTTPVAVLPGPRWLQVVGPSGQGVAQPQTVVLKIQPCTYYYLGARRDSAVGNNWKLVVDAEETIQACDPADELRKAKAAAKPVTPATPPASH
jgi:hypothetical protein